MGFHCCILLVHPNVNRVCSSTESGSITGIPIFVRHRSECAIECGWRSASGSVERSSTKRKRYDTTSSYQLVFCTDTILSAMALFCAFTMVGPTFAPAISGYVSASLEGWRMAFWIGVIVAGVSLPLLVFCPETYGPILLVHRARKMRNEGDKDAIAPLELDERSLSSIFATALTRPFRMFWKESIVFLTSIFLALLYGTFYLFFTSYPLIFQGQYCRKNISLRMC